MCIFMYMRRVYYLRNIEKDLHYTQSLDIATELGKSEIWSLGSLTFNKQTKKKKVD